MTMVDPLALDRQVCFALAAASRSVVAMYRPILEPLGLTHPQYLVMLALWERSPRNSREISDALYLEPATLSPLLKRLEAAGLLSRRKGLSDERTLSIELTATGQALRAKAEAVPGQVLALLQMDIDTLEATRDALTELLAATTQARESA
jgi:DNA-binding MarR family transcriptional regulator